MDIASLGLQLCHRNPHVISGHQACFALQAASVGHRKPESRVPDPPWLSQRLAKRDYVANDRQSEHAGFQVSRAAHSKDELDGGK